MEIEQIQQKQEQKLLLKEARILRTSLRRKDLVPEKRHIDNLTYVQLVGLNAFMMNELYNKFDKVSNHFWRDLKIVIFVIQRLKTVFPEHFSVQQEKEFQDFIAYIKTKKTNNQIIFNTIVDYSLENKYVQFYDDYH